MTFEEFKAEVDKRMIAKYAISIKDAGISEGELAEVTLEGWSPDEYVKWYGEHYDLTPVEEYEPGDAFGDYYGVFGDE